MQEIMTCTTNLPHFGQATLDVVDKQRVLRMQNHASPDPAVEAVLCHAISRIIALPERL